MADLHQTRTPDQPREPEGKASLTQIKQASGAFALSLMGVRTRDLRYDEVFEGNPMKSACLLLAMFSVLGISTVRAQMTVDVAKIRCRQLLLGHVRGSTRSVANWLSDRTHRQQAAGEAQLYFNALGAEK